MPTCLDCTSQRRLRSSGKCEQCDEVTALDFDQMNRSQSGSSRDTMNDFLDNRQSFYETFSGLTHSIVTLLDDTEDKILTPSICSKMKSLFLQMQVQVLNISQSRNNDHNLANDNHVSTGNICNNNFTSSDAIGNSRVDAFSKSKAFYSNVVQSMKENDNSN